ncbi:MAG TPA: hypothetical protein VGN00_16530 [Puia sp.]|jgi:hypothetical protein
MTLVVRQRNYSSPTLVGDLLLTAKTNEQSYILPAIGQDITRFIPAGKARPVDLAQKLYIFGDNVGIVVTGDVGEIIKLLEDLQPFCSAGWPPEKIIEEARAYDYSNFKESSYMLMIFDNSQVAVDGMIRVTEATYGGGFDSEDNPFFKEWRLGGSGSLAFEELVNEERQFYSSFSEDDPRSPIVKNGALFSRLLSEERYFLKPLDARYGGGYEMAFYDGTRLQKLNNIAYILQTGKYDPEGKVAIELPLMINYYRYEGNDLYITAIELHDLHISHEGDIQVMTATQLKAGCLRIPQLVRGERAESAEVKSFETCSVGLGFVIHAPNENWFKPSCYSGTQALAVSFSFEKKEVEIRLHREFQEYIATKFSEAYPNFTSAPLT